MTTKQTFIVYNLTTQKDKPDYWNKVGRAFPFQTEDGRQGINFPNMKLVLLEPKAEEDTEN